MGDGMDSKFNKIELKLDKVSDDIVEIKQIMERNTVSLEYHIKRTDILEKKLEPVESHVQRVEGATSFLIITAKILGGVAAIVSIILGIYTVLN